MNNPSKNSVMSKSKEHKPDYKKTFFEDCLNNKGIPISQMARVMQKYGYFYDCENGVYRVYDSYEWNMRKEFQKNIQPLVESIMNQLL